MVISEVFLIKDSKIFYFVILFIFSREDRIYTTLFEKWLYNILYIYIYIFLEKKERKDFKKNLHIIVFNIWAQSSIRSYVKLYYEDIKEREEKDTFLKKKKNV